MHLRSIVWVTAASVLTAGGAFGAGLELPHEWAIPQLVAQAGGEAAEAGGGEKKSESEAAPGGYTAEQIAEMISNPLGYLSVVRCFVKLSTG